MSETREKILPILVAAYGGNSMAVGLAEYLSGRIDGGKWDGRGREHMVMQICWQWFPGGGTAQNVARRIEEAVA